MMLKSMIVQRYNLNTSHVTVNLMMQKYMIVQEYNLNTSHVTVNTIPNIIRTNTDTI